MFRNVLMVVSLVGLMVSCSPQTDKRRCVSDQDCLSGEECFQSFCRVSAGGCRAGETRPCYTGAEGTKGKGPCKEGVQTCNNNGAWDPYCAGEIQPGVELCDGIDNDCDGRVDNPAGSAQAFTRPCYRGPNGTQGKGACKAGIETCQSGNWSSCTGEVLPSLEVCGNNIDDDCDGQVDNAKNLGQPCTIPGAAPECRNGTYTCGTGGQLVCSPQGKQEVCNGKDDNCNGLVDENNCPCQPNQTRPCGATDEGVCQKGTQRCVNGTWSTTCEGMVGPKTETCNGLDDDCDGKTDNIASTSDPLFQPCYTGPAATKGKGPCKEGKRLCVNGGWSNECKGQVVPQPEFCANNVDDNCDGLVDNVRDIGEACLDDKRKGRCRGGVYRCWGANRICLDLAPYYKGPIKEECNGVDDDCDGFVDNATKDKKDPLSQACGADKGECKKGKKLCVNGRWSDTCQGEVRPAPELCNGKDDNCDGKTDEGGVCGNCTTGQVRSCYNGPTATRSIGACKEGTERCVNGKWDGSCVGAIVPKAETCNNLDDDCDGRVDNQPGSTTPLQQACFTGAASTRGVGHCVDGIQSCTNGAWAACAWEVKSQPEICDKVDNDCDGAVDEDFVCFGKERKLKELCSRDPNAMAYEKCGAGLACIQASPSTPNAFCYQTCTDNSSCAANKDGRTQCLEESVTLQKICLGLAPDGAVCDEPHGILCQQGMVCDSQTRRCRRPSVAPPGGACDGETRMVCGPGYRCTQLTPGLPYGFCVKECTVQNSCDKGVFCYFLATNQGVCIPKGTQKQDQLCGNPSGDKIKDSNYCGKDLFCYRPSATNPNGICVPVLPQCNCPSGRVCLQTPSGCLSLKSCGTCPSGQACVQLNTNAKACLPQPPTGNVPFGGKCSLTNRCLPKLLCLAPPGSSVGHCTQTACSSDADCPKTPAGAACRVITPNLDKACVFPCQTDSDCPSQFACQPQSNLCFPK